jgi:hypothetical protein
VSYEAEKNKHYLRRRYHIQRAFFFTMVGEKCRKCGATEDLEFDHIDPDKKSFDVGALWPRHKIPAVLEELKKCQALCRPCHEAKSAREFSEARSGTFRHGTWYSLQKMKCRCEECLKVRDKRNADRRISEGARGPYGRPSTHGEVLHYNRGCRCDECRAANAARERERRAGMA